MRRLIFNWLNDTRFSPSDAEETSEDAVLPITVSNDATPEPVADCSPVLTTLPSRLEIALSGGHRLSVEGHFDGAELARLLKGLLS